MTSEVLGWMQHVGMSLIILGLLMLALGIGLCMTETAIWMAQNPR